MNDSKSIAIIAQEYMSLGIQCRSAIQRQLTAATAAGDQAEMRKWHRVQVDVRRLARGEPHTSVGVRAAAETRWSWLHPANWN